MTTTHPPRHVAAVDRTRRQMLGGLIAWSVISVGVGVPLWAFGRPLFSAFGMQCVIWGLINLLIASPGWFKGPSVDPAAEHGNLLGALRISNRYLNPLWLTVGLLLFGIGLTRPQGDLQQTVWFGHAAGVTAQALFLTGFDRLFVTRLRRLDR